MRKLILTGLAASLIAPVGAWAQEGAQGPPPPTEGVVLLVEGEDGSRAALVADAIHGQRQVVIKSLEQNYQQVEGVAAATILGDGRVALILDVDAVINLRRRSPPPAVDPSLIAAE